MKRPNRKKSISTDAFLKAKPYANHVMTVEEKRTGGAVVTVPMKRPRWLVPPLSWLLPYSDERKVALDSIGRNVLAMCDGRRNVEAIIEEFARINKLSYREAQLPVTQFLRQMTERGLIAIVGHDTI